jgi:hypothetical protein
MVQVIESFGPFTFAELGIAIDSTNKCRNFRIKYDQSVGCTIQ